MLEMIDCNLLYVAVVPMQGCSLLVNFERDRGGRSTELGSAKHFCQLAAINLQTIHYKLGGLVGTDCIKL